MASKKKKDKKQTQTASQAGKSATNAAQRGVASSTVIPFAPFLSDFSPNKDMESLMNSQKNQFEKFSNDATEQARQAGDIFMKSGTIMMKGCEQIMKTCMAMAQSTTERNTEALKDLMACKTINDLTEAQNRLSQQNFDELMQNATKLSEICIKVCTEAFDPINDQFSKAIKKASEQMAA